MPNNAQHISRKANSIKDPLSRVKSRSLANKQSRARSKPVHFIGDSGDSEVVKIPVQTTVQSAPCKAKQPLVPPVNRKLDSPTKASRLSYIMHCVSEHNQRVSNMSFKELGHYYESVALKLFLGVLAICLVIMLIVSLFTELH